MDLAGLQELKKLLQYEKKLDRIYLFFQDNFGDKEEFIAVGERTRDPFLEAVIAQIGGQLFGANGTVTNLILCRISEHQFVHGGFALGGRFGAVIYFEDVRMGLLGVPAHPAFTDPSGEMKYARFSGQPMPSPGKPSRN